MFGNRTLDRLNRMLDEAIDGEFQEMDYDESQLSRLESKWKQYLGYTKTSRESIEKEKENVKSLISDISHQTKTPMTNIKMYAQLLEENLETGTVEANRKLLAEILRQTEKLEFLIQVLMKMSRLEGDIVKVDPVVQPVAALIDEAAESIRLKAKQKEIKIRVDSHEGIMACYDKKWTLEALENVLDNAVKYGPPGSVVTVSVNPYEFYTAISVKDQGPGIREEELPKIFGRFYRGEAVSQEDGVGIGLYLTREILRKEDGYIRAISKPQEGSEFILYLKSDR